MAELQESNSSGSKSMHLKGDTTSADYRKDPYYIHSSDNLGLQLVLNQLTMNNYLVWNQSMLIALKAKNKIGFINGTC